MGGVIVGYLVMFAFVFVTFTVAFLLMGTERAFKPGSYDVSGLWIGVSFILALAAAILGGLVCAWIARDTKALVGLAGLVLVLGFLMALPVLTAKAEPKARSGAVGNMEAMQNAAQPAWIALLNPLVGAGGALVGGRLRRQSHQQIGSLAPTSCGG